MRTYKEVLVNGNVHIAVLVDGQIVRISSGVCGLSNSRLQDVNSCAAAEAGVDPATLEWEEFDEALTRC